MRDLLHGMRLLRKNPAYTVVATFALSVGLGANLTIFGYVNALLLRPLSVWEPERVVRAYGGTTVADSLIAFADYLEYRDRNQSLTGLAAYHPGGLRGIRIDGPMEHVAVTPVTGNYFETLGVRALLGRAISPEDDRHGAPAVAMLSDAYWGSRFGRDARVVGRTVTINGCAFQIVGVTPPAFEGTAAPVIPQLYAPWQNACTGAAAAGHLIGRLRPGVSRSEARADLSRIATQLSEERGCRTAILVYPAHILFPGFFSVASSYAALLMAVVMLVLLVACSNIAILLLAQTVERRREVAIRLALGATRWQVIRQFLAESLLISIAGGVGALALATVTARFLSQIYLPTPMPIALTFHFDWRVGAFGAALCVAATLLYGLGPAVQSSKADVRTALQQVSLSAGRSGARSRSALVAAQFAFSTLLLATAAAALQSATALGSADLGFSPRNVLMATVDFHSSGYTPAQTVRVQEQFLAGAEQSPGILSAALVDVVPLSQPMPTVEVGGESNQTNQNESVLRVSSSHIAGQFFRTLEIPLLAGRVFDSRDTTQSAPVCIVNEALAQQLWAGQNPLGKRLREASGDSVEVVGLVRDSKYESIAEQSKPFLYRPATQQSVSTATFLLKTDASPAAAIATVRELMAELDPSLLAYNLSPLEERIGLNLLPNRVLAWLASSLGILALVLGAVGTFGLLSFLVSQRRHEMGIRMALGAQRLDVLRLVFGYGLRLAITGVTIGLAGSLAATRLLASYLHGIPERDPLLLAGVALVLCGTAFVACLVPALRACKTDPLSVIRHE